MTRPSPGDGLSKEVPFLISISAALRFRQVMIAFSNSVNGTIMRIRYELATNLKI